MITIQFAVDLPDGRSVTEQDLTENFQDLQGAAAAGSPYGSLIFRDDSGQNDGFYDTLGYLMTNLCLTAIPQLDRGVEVIVEYFSSPGQMKLTPEGEEIALYDSERGPDCLARFPKKEFLTALLACVGRYFEFQEKLGGSGDGTALALAFQSDAYDSVKAALEEKS